MDPNLKFSCGYKPAGVNQDSSASCGGIIGSVVVAIVLITVSVKDQEWGMLLFLLPFSALFFWGGWKGSMDQYIHVTATELQVVRSDEKVLLRWALKDIWGVNAPDRETLDFMVRSGESGRSCQMTLKGVADIDGLIAAMAKWGHVQSAAMQMIPEVPVLPQPQPKPQPILQRTLTDEEADELHAAQHLLNQGMISEQQYSGLLVPPVQQPVPLPAEDINAMNAADYQQRQEQLAQQLGTVLPDAAEEKEKDENGRAGFI